MQTRCRLQMRDISDAVHDDNEEVDANRVVKNWEDSATDVSDEELEMLMTSVEHQKLMHEPVVTKPVNDGFDSRRFYNR